MDVQVTVTAIDCQIVKMFTHPLPWVKSFQPHLFHTFLAQEFDFLFKGIGEETISLPPHDVDVVVSPVILFFVGLCCF